MGISNYRVKIQCDDGRVTYRECNTMEQAWEYYDEVDGEAEIQQYNAALGTYEIVVYPAFEY